MGITVTFHNIEEEFATDGNDQIVIEGIGDHIFEKNGGELSEMSKKDKIEHQDLIQSLTPKEAIEEALTIISSAPTFDRIPVGEVDRSEVKATVEFKQLDR